MNQIAIITPVPDVIDTLISNSILRKAVERNVVKFHIVNLRQFGLGNYRQIDDTPFGGGSGMVMMAEPWIKAIEHTTGLIGRSSGDAQIIYPSPQGETWSQKSASQTSKLKKLIVICGHYKGIDQRIRDKIVTDGISIGDYVLTGGELPALVILDSIIRLIPGVLNNYESAQTDSFADTLLDCPYY